MTEIDIVFNIDYRSKMDIGPLYFDIPNYIEFIQVSDEKQFIRLINLMKDDVSCFVWLHPSYSAERVEKGFSSKIVKECMPFLEKIGIEYNVITRSTGKTAEKGIDDVDSMLDLKSGGKRSYSVAQIKKLLKKIPDKSMVGAKNGGGDDESLIEKILFVASSPENEERLNAGKEQRIIEEAITMSSRKDYFEIISKPGAKFETLTRELMKNEPQFVHFSGHGNNDCLAFEKDDGETQIVPSIALEELFRAIKKNNKCVFLSACYSKEQAEAISKNNIHVIGMNDSVGVEDATIFAKGFYQAIGEGQSIETAFKMGKVHYISVCDMKDRNIPELWYNGIKTIF